jgi:GDP/UDP-N,N'-diacetylbacillosamine 2-epimerase (hydrolysing)
LEEFKSCFKIDLSKPSFLITYHSETVSGEKNKLFAEELVRALESFLDYQLIITMPNADAQGNTMRDVYKNFALGKENIRLVESFGTQGFFTCMQHASLVIGNSSSGIIEAASFKKHAVNIGNRQMGRAISYNVIPSSHDAESIRVAIKEGIKKGLYQGENIYYKSDVAQSIIKVLKKKWKN